MLSIDWGFFWAIFTKIGSRYYLIAGVFFLVFYILFKKYFNKKKIQKRDVKPKDYIREIAYSSGTMLIFSSFILYLHSPNVAPHTTRYYTIAERGWTYYFMVFPILLIMHDTYFYWMHRLIHHPKLFKIIHLVHHQSTNPSPWAAYAFHPLEAILEQGIVFVFYFTIPIHITHLGLFFLFSIIYNVYGHLGYELYPTKFNQTLIGKWMNTSVSHNQHHQYFTGNYGLYFLFWDRIMGTLRADYDESFDKIGSSKKTKQLTV